jgi:hypothetical protein
MREKRKRCSQGGCRRLATGDGRCPDHQVGQPTESVKRLSEVEKLRFLEVSTALRNHAQEIKILSMEQQLEDATYAANRKKRQDDSRELRQTIQLRMAEQHKMMEDLGKKYDFDPTRVSIDDRSGAVHEHKD